MPEVKNKKLPVVLLAALAVLALGFVAWFLFLRGGGPGGDQAHQMEAPVLVATPTEVALVAQLPGRLEAFRQAEVMARVPGIVIERCYKEGQEVQQGEALFKIDPAPYQADMDIAAANVARAKAEFDAAKDKVNRQKGLVSARAVSERDYMEAMAAEKSASANLLYAQASLEKAKLQLSYATVTAPIAGRARRAMVTEGALVGQAGVTHLTTIDQMDPVYVNFSQSAAEVMALQEAIRQGALEDASSGESAVELLLPDGRPYPHKGRLVFSDLSVDPNTDSIVMRASFPNPERVLLPGAYVRVKLVNAINHKAFLVPRDALMRNAQGAVLFVLSPEGVVTVRPVTANDLQGKNWVVTQGLQGGEQIIIAGHVMLKPGAQAKAKVLGPTPSAAQAQSQNGQNGQPGKPAQPEQPAQAPSQPEQAAQPAQPEQPVQSAQPEQPEQGVKETPAANSNAPQQGTEQNAKGKGE